MKVQNENSQNITVKFNKDDFLKIQNFFRCNKPGIIKGLCKDEEFSAIKKLVYLDDVNKGLYDEIGKLLDSKKN